MFGKPGPKQSMRKASVSGRRWHFPQSRMFWISCPSPVFFHVILPQAYRLPTSFQTGLFFVEVSPRQVTDDSSLSPFFQISIGSRCILLNVLLTLWETSTPFNGLASVEGPAAKREQHTSIPNRTALDCRCSNSELLLFFFSSLVKLDGAGNLTSTEVISWRKAYLLCLRLLFFCNQPLRVTQ